MSKPVCYVMVGLPATGKSTHVNQMTEIDPSVFVYSTDNLIEIIAKEIGSTYDKIFNTMIKTVTQTADGDLDVAIRNKQDIIWDQTNLGVGKRRKIIRRMRQAGYQVRCICILPPEAGWLDDQKAWAARLRNRPGKTIPQPVLSNMIKSFVKPTADEGFDSVTYYSMHGAVLGIDRNENG